MPKEFELLRERLLRAGIGAALAGRYIAELKDHLDDLRAEEQRAGWSPNDADARAMRRLGYVDDLAEAMIARREMRSWSARAPAAAYVVAPSVILAAATALWLAALVGVCSWLRAHAAWEPADLPARIRPFADGAAWFSNTTLAMVLGWGLAANAIRQRAPLMWPIVGLVVLAAAGAALQV
ncbi:MAG: permease prefix domain 1-containing protein, partial [Phenylobacterium sp.]